jgi:hypothetical protein
VFTHETAPKIAATVTAALSLVLAGALLAPASADTPAGWEKAPSVSAFDFLLVLILLPLAAAAVISILAFVPSLAGDRGYQPGQSWRGESEWFGGPTKGISAADEVSPQQLESSLTGTGGTSGRW